jgi:hypothetical protein
MGAEITLHIANQRIRERLAEAEANRLVGDRRRFAPDADVPATAPGPTPRPAGSRWHLRAAETRR